MDSFGLWYKVDDKDDDEKKSGIVRGKKVKDATFEMHINLWSKLNKETYLDIGIKIFEYKEIDELRFLCPFKLEDNDVKDLSEKISIKDNIDLILNNDADIETKDNYVIIKDHEKDSQYLIFPFKQAVQNVQRIEPIGEANSKIIIDFRDFKQYIKDLKSTETSDSNKSCGCDLEEVKNLYIRFRIKSRHMKKILFNDLVPADNFLQSGFVGTRVIDFKMNNIRNIPPTIRATASRYKEYLAEFECIHFLLMEPAENNIEYMSNTMTCRRLEDRWNDYLDLKTDKSPSILVYHSKKCSEKNNKLVNKNNTNYDTELIDNKKIKEFNQLVKISYSKTNWKIIMNYIFYVIILGIISGIVANAMCKFWLKW